MKLFRTYFLPMLGAALALGFTAMSTKPKVAITFFIQADQQDTNSFATPLKLLNSNTEIYIRKIPEITDSNIVEIFPFAASDGTYGCAFKLDEDGKMNLTALSIRKRGSILIALINGQQIADLLIDRTVSDGIVTIPSGITPQQMEFLKKSYHVYKPKPKSDKTKKSDEHNLPNPANETPNDDDSSFANHHDYGA